MTTTSVDIVENFDVWHAFREWRYRGIEGEELRQLLRRERIRCKRAGHKATVTNIDRMLEVLEG